MTPAGPGDFPGVIPPGAGPWVLPDLRSGGWEGRILELLGTALTVTEKRIEMERESEQGVGHLEPRL